MPSIPPPISSIKIRSKRLNGHTQIRLLITHAMANGRGKDRHGNVIPAHYITVLVITHNDLAVLTSHLSASIAKNPYFDFVLKGDNKGDKINVSWTDNLGSTDSVDYIIQ